MSHLNQIWQPKTVPNNQQLPFPSCESIHHDRIYTKTSLKSNPNSLIESINQEIIKVSESHNRAAKSLSEHRKFRQDLQSIEQQSDPNCSNTMSSKLVHHQYNSPIDLYSMNNIKKTIEAHSELIAPGVKGINFMKSNEPVNRESEVYKLVMEEERRSKSPAPQQASTGSLGPSTIYPNGVSMSAQPYRVHGSSPQNRDATHWCKDNLPGSGHEDGIRSTVVDSKPKCCECGQPINGPFAKLQDRFIHPHCFNCTTCGTSLKNSGYFTINDKLYCDIHARHVTNVMRLNYNFEPNKLSHQPAPSSTNNSSSVNERREVSWQRSPTAVKLIGQDEPKNVTRVENSTEYSPSRGVANNWPTVDQNKRACNHHGNNCCISCTICSMPTVDRTTTISTMFSDCSAVNHCNRQCSCGQSTRGLTSAGKDIVWTWRPTLASNHRSCGQNCRPIHEMMSEPSTNKDMVREIEGSLAPIRSNQNACLPHSVLPVCVQCKTEIHGPYILAGRSTWCKPCSEANFICFSCKRSLLNCGFIERGGESSGARRSQYYCETCYEHHLAPTCSKCLMKIKGDCLNALGKQWHPSCFVCGHCRQPFGNSSFYLEDNVPYCRRDWDLLFTTKCSSCSNPIQAGDKWIDALNKSYHADCFRCATCHTKLEGSTFYCKGGRPLCKIHAR